MAKKICWVCGYTDWTGIGFTTWLKHKVHVSCLMFHLSAKNRTMELLKKTLMEEVGNERNNNKI